MGKSIRFSDFIIRLCNKTKLSEKTIRKVYDNLFELVAEELRYADEVKLKRFGTFYTQQRGGRDAYVPQPDGTRISRYIEPYQSVRFKPSAEFINYANGRLIDKESKKRQRRGQLTKNERKLISINEDKQEKNRRLDLLLEDIVEEN